MSQSPPSRHSAARRNAEALLSKAQKREQNFKLEQERESEAVALKTARLRELRLAKEAEDEKLKAAARPAAPRAPKPRRSKQT
jgi:hypothetical protein